MTLFIKNRNCYWTVVWNLCNTPDRSSSFSVEPVLLAQEVTNKTVAVVISKTLKILSELRVLKSSFLSEDDRINSMKYTSWYNDINAINMIYSIQQINFNLWDFIGIYLWSRLNWDFCSESGLLWLKKAEMHLISNSNLKAGCPKVQNCICFPIDWLSI